MKPETKSDEGNGAFDLDEVLFGKYVGR